MLQDVAGCFPDEPSEEGLRFSHTGNSNYSFENFCIIATKAFPKKEPNRPAPAITGTEISKSIKKFTNVSRKNKNPVSTYQTDGVTFFGES